MQKNLHPSVIKFKEFVKNNPALIKEVRNGNSTWQEMYEDWFLLGEEDNRWEKLGATPSSPVEPEEDKRGLGFNNPRNHAKNGSGPNPALYK